MPRDIYNVNIENQTALISPGDLKKDLPVDDDLTKIIVESKSVFIGVQYLNSFLKEKT